MTFEEEPAFIGFLSKLGIMIMVLFPVWGEVEDFMTALMEFIKSSIDSFIEERRVTSELKN